MIRDELALSDNDENKMYGEDNLDEDGLMNELNS
jgi:hypothetical protein